MSESKSQMLLDELLQVAGHIEGEANFNSSLASRRKKKLRNLENRFYRVSDQYRAERDHLRSRRNEVIELLNNLMPYLEDMIDTVDDKQFTNLVANTNVWLEKESF